MENEKVLGDYFKNVTPEQFKKEWEEAVGHLPKNNGPTVSELSQSWNEYYGDECLKSKTTRWKKNK